MHAYFSSILPSSCVCVSLLFIRFLHDFLPLPHLDFYFGVRLFFLRDFSAFESVSSSLDFSAPSIFPRQGLLPRTNLSETQVANDWSLINRSRFLQQQRPTTKKINDSLSTWKPLLPQPQWRASWCHRPLIGPVTEGPSKDRRKSQSSWDCRARGRWRGGGRGGGVGVIRHAFGP